MSMPDAYTASSIPLRRAKRPKFDASHRTIPTLAPSISQRSDAAAGDVADDPDVSVTPSSSPSARKRTGRKSGNMSRAAREAQRKANHSLIEKARRTKINEALATLRRIVPADYQRSDLGIGDDVQVDGSSAASSKKDEKEKEFKLEILERTVGYLQDLKERVRVMEDEQSRNCQDYTGNLRRNRNASDEPGDSSSRGGGPLPSIASWLPQRYRDPSSVPVTPSMSPASTSSLSQTLLHTPAHLGQRVLAPPPPPLTLPSPNLRPHNSKPTPEDETAATMLLHIASSPLLSPSSSDTSVTSSTKAEPAPSPRRSQAKPQTPGSMLGLSSHRILI